MSYSTLIQKLYKTNVFNPIKSGLDNMIRLNTLLKSPLQSIPIVHVTGTNGKGSVSMKIARCLQHSNIKTGLFSSPHISSFRERVAVNEELIAEADVESIFPDIFEKCTEHAIPATFFELTTALAFIKFKLAQCEAVVLEVGLGGRLDATNIVAPSLCVITAIQLDHTKILGDTIEKIALEKAGIMKRGVDVLVGPGCPLDVMKAEASRVGANLYTVDDLLSPHERKYNPTQQSNDIVDIDTLNQDIAHAALRLLQRRPQHRGGIFDRLVGEPAQSFETALSTRPPCRFEVFRQSVPSSEHCTKRRTSRIEVVLDLAHNVEALRSLVEKVKLNYSGVPIRVVMGMSEDKDIASCVPHVLSLVGRGRADRIHCTAARHPRAMSPQELRRITNSLANVNSDNDSGSNNDDNGDKVSVPVPDVPGSQFDSSDVRSAVRTAIQTLADECAASAASRISGVTEQEQQQLPDTADGVVIVCGTAFIMSDARAELEVDEPRDSDDLFFSPTQLKQQ